MQKYATNIIWDVDGDVELAQTLPTEICIDEVCGIDDDTEECEEAISNYLSDKTGYCFLGYNVIIK